MNDSSVGDCANLGMAVLLANWTGGWYTDALDYAGAAEDELNLLIRDATPHTDRAISHLRSEVQLWVRSCSFPFSYKLLPLPYCTDN